MFEITDVQSKLVKMFVVLKILQYLFYIRNWLGTSWIWNCISVSGRCDDIRSRLISNWKCKA